MKLLNPYLNAVSALPLARDVRKELAGYPETFF